MQKFGDDDFGVEIQAMCTLKAMVKYLERTKSLIKKLITRIKS